MAFRVSQANFSRGEISEELVARIDVASYGTALKKARNVVILKYGGVTKRPGTRFVSTVYADEGVRLIPFQYSLTQTYALEFGQGYMRAASQGGLVIEDKLTIQGVTRGTRTGITAAYHGYSVGDQVYFSDVAGATDLNGKIGRVTDVTSDSLFWVDIDSSNYDDFTADAGGTIRSATPAPAPTPPVVPPPAVVETPPDLAGWNFNLNDFRFPYL